MLYDCILARATALESVSAASQDRPAEARRAAREYVEARRRVAARRLRSWERIQRAVSAGSEGAATRVRRAMSGGGVTVRASLASLQPMQKYLGSSRNDPAHIIRSMMRYIEDTYGGASDAHILKPARASRVYPVPILEHVLAESPYEASEMQYAAYPRFGFWCTDRKRGDRAMLHVDVERFAADHHEATVAHLLLKAQVTKLGTTLAPSDVRRMPPAVAIEFDRVLGDTPEERERRRVHVVRAFALEDSMGAMGLAPRIVRHGPGWHATRVCDADGASLCDINGGAESRDATGWRGARLALMVWAMLLENHVLVPSRVSCSAVSVGRSGTDLRLRHVSPSAVAFVPQECGALEVMISASRALLALGLTGLPSSPSSPSA